MANIKEQVLQEQVLHEYKKLERLEKLAREGFPLYVSEEKKLMKLQQDYAHFILQPEVIQLISPAFEDFQQQVRKGNFPTPSEIAEVIISILLEATNTNQIFIPHNPEIVEDIACLLLDIYKSLKQGSKLILTIFTGIGTGSEAFAGDPNFPLGYSNNRRNREANND